MHNNFKILIFVFIAALSLALPFSVYAADSYKANAGATVEINEHGTCQNVKNNASSAVLVPTKTSGEWSSFRSNAPNVVLSSCSSSTWQSNGMNWGSGCAANSGSCPGGGSNDISYMPAIDSSCSVLNLNCGYDDPEVTACLFMRCTE